MEQRSPEWYAVRLGKVTGSQVSAVLAKRDSATRANYLSELVVERLTGQQAEFFMNDAMQHGIDTEPQARMAYEAHKGVLVDEIGFVNHAAISNFGCSPDGLVGLDGLIEIKCPNTATHIDTLLGGEIAKKYYDQMQWQMACTGRSWCDFVSFDPRMPEELQLFIKRIPRDDKYLAELEGEVIQFLKEVDEKVNKLNALKG